MNLITCAEPCEYQQEGYCSLDGEATVSAIRGNGCSYFKPLFRKDSLPKGDVPKERISEGTLPFGSGELQ